jgi:hypothetical protein
MNIEYLCEIIKLPACVIENIKNYLTENTIALDEKLEKKLTCRQTWDEAVKELKERIGEDPNGFHILAEMLNYCCQTYDEYINKGIDKDIFVETMKFCTRFINEHKEFYGYYAFKWAWWFPRQLSMCEFRIEELEFEFVEANVKKIYIHIPSDANLSSEYVEKSFKAYNEFLEKFYPEWQSVEWYCESWLLSPSLDELLPLNSNIINFKNLFEIESVDNESMAVLDWVFPGEKTEISKLSEKTTLQKNMKNYLISGGKVGWAEGKIKNKSYKIK